MSDQRPDISKMGYRELVSLVAKGTLSTRDELEAVDKLTKMQESMSFKQIIETGTTILLMDEKRGTSVTNEEKRQNRKEMKKQNQELKSLFKRSKELTSEINEFRKKRDHANTLTKQFKEARNSNSVPKDLENLLSEKLGEHDLTHVAKVDLREALHQLVLIHAKTSEEYHKKYIEKKKEREKISAKISELKDN